MSNDNKLTVFVHLASVDNAPEKMRNEEFTFLRLPVIGEYITFGREDGLEPLYRVELVFHCPLGTDYIAEVYAKPAQGNDNPMEAFGM